MTKKRKVHSLTGRITPTLMMQAWKAVKRNRGAAGIDKVGVQMFQENLDVNLKALMRDLKKGNFQPKPLRRAWIPKDAKGKKLRPLGIPALPTTRFGAFCPLGCALQAGRPHHKKRRSVPRCSSPETASDTHPNRFRRSSRLRP